MLTDASWIWTQAAMSIVYEGNQYTTRVFYSLSFSLYIYIYIYMSIVYEGNQYTTRVFYSLSFSLYIYIYIAYHEGR